LHCSVARLDGYPGVFPCLYSEGANGTFAQRREKPSSEETQKAKTTRRPHGRGEMWIGVWRHAVGSLELELELELIQSHMAQKPVLRSGARA